MTIDAKAIPSRVSSSNVSAGRYYPSNRGGSIDSLLKSVHEVSRDSLTALTLVVFQVVLELVAAEPSHPPAAEVRYELYP